MGNVPTYVDFIDYCNELCNITQLEFNEVEPVVNNVFLVIMDGQVTLPQGFILLENTLNVLMANKEANQLGPNLRLVPAM